MRHVLTGVARVLSEHRWSVAAPAKGLEWFTSDHPALRLNYYGPGQYGFGGGWDYAGSELMLPLSPEHLLYVQVGRRNAPRFTFPAETTQLVQQMLAERAHRWIFARHPSDLGAVLRPRVVDPAAITHEREEWERWRADNRDQESTPETEI